MAQCLQTKLAAALSIVAATYAGRLWLMIAERTLGLWSERFTEEAW